MYLVRVCVLGVQKPETDYWRKTYYTPLLLKDNGHFLNKVMATDDDFVLETTFTLTPFRQFDQAGNDHCVVSKGRFGLARGLSCVRGSDVSLTKHSVTPTHQPTYVRHHGALVSRAVDQDWH